jgi:hypothetical protein
MNLSISLSNYVVHIRPQCAALSTISSPFMGLDRWRGPNGFSASPNGRRLSLQVSLLGVGCLGGPVCTRPRWAHPCRTFIALVWLTLAASPPRLGLGSTQVCEAALGNLGYSWVLWVVQRRRTEDVQVCPFEEPCDRRGEASFSSRTHTRPHARTHASTHTHTNTRVPPTVWSGVPHRG